MVKSAKFQMTIHIDYDREENKIQFLMASQTKMIRTLNVSRVLYWLDWKYKWSERSKIEIGIRGYYLH